MLDRIKEELEAMCSPNSVFTKFRTSETKHEKWIDLEKEWQFFVIQDRDNNNPNYKGRVTLYALSRFSTLTASFEESKRVFSIRFLISRLHWLTSQSFVLGIRVEKRDKA